MIINKDVIKSRNNPLVKWICTLHDKKGRERERSFIAEGHKLVFEAISAGLEVTDCIIMESKVGEFLTRLSNSLGSNCDKTKITIVDDSVFEKILTINEEKTYFFKLLTNICVTLDFCFFKIYNNFLLFCFVFSIVDLQHYIIFRCSTW